MDARAPYLLSPWDAKDAEIAAEVRLHEHAHRPGALRVRQHARGGADAALPAEGDRSRPRADRAFLNHSCVRRLECLPHVQLADWAGADGVEEAVVRLPHDWVDGPHLLHPRLREPETHEGIVGFPDAQRTGEKNGRLELPELRYLGRAEQLPETVADVGRGGAAVVKEGAALRQDRRDNLAD